MAVIPDEVARAARANLKQLEGYKKEVRARLRELLREAMGEVAEEIRDLPAGHFRRQQGAVVHMLGRLLQERGPEQLENLIGAVNQRAYGMGIQHVGDEIGDWLEHYGHEVRPVNLDAVAELEAPTLIEQYPRSLERYGRELAREVAAQLQMDVLTRRGPDHAIEAVRAATDAQRWRADRIVRTELSNAYNAAHNRGLIHTRDSGQVPGLQKSAIATFDNRTDQDSYPVHGQVRELEEPFVDGQGREYQHPPGRPNDREKEIPYIASDAEVGGDLVEEGGRGGTEVSDREEGRKRAEADRERLRKRRERRREKRRKRRRARNDAERKKRGLPPRNRPDPEDLDALQEYHTLHWNNSSTSEQAVELKAAAAEEFGLPGTPYNPDDVTVSPEHVAQSRELTRQMYRKTQRDFAEKDTRKLTLYRGIKEDYATQGTLESWSSSPRMARKFAGKNGHVIEDEIDVRRILTSHESPGWVQGRYGAQQEYVVMSAKPRLEWQQSDFEIGFFQASELDDKPLAAGQWGILRGSEGVELYHRPTGKKILGGTNYSKADMREAAEYIRKLEVFDAAGELRDADTLADAIDVARVRWGAATPSGYDAARAVEFEGRMWATINEGVDPGSPDTWSKRKFKVVLDDFDDTFSVEEFEGYTRKAIGIYRDEEGFGYGGSWNLVHLPTGRRIHGGPENFFERGHRVPIDLGGWKRYHFQAWADELDKYLDPETGAVLDQEKFDHTIEVMRDLDTADEPDAVRGLLDGDDADDDDWDWLPGPREDTVKSYRDEMRPQKKTSKSRSDHTPESELTLEEAVERRRAAMRRGRYNRYKDPELEEAVVEEIKRQREAEAKARHERWKKRQEETEEAEESSDPAEHLERTREQQRAEERERRAEEYDDAQQTDDDED